MTEELIAKIKESGHSRIPVYQTTMEGKNEITGILLVKKLIGLSNTDRIFRVEDFEIGQLLKFDGETNLLDALQQFKKGHSHLGVVYEKKIALGIATLEDVVEALIQEQIQDETDSEIRILLQNQD